MPASVKSFAGLFRSAGNPGIRRHDARRYRLIESAAGHIGGQGAECGAPIGHGVMKLFEYQAIGRQVAFFERAVVVAFECFAQDVVGLVLHGV